MKRTVVTLLCSVLVGCTSFYPVETTPGAFVRDLQPGDTVKLTTRDREEFTLRVLFVTDAEIKGRLKDSGQALDVRFDRIEALEVEQLNLKKALLTTFLPAVIAVAIACRSQDCDTHTILTTTE